MSETTKIKRWTNWCLATHGHDMVESETGLYVYVGDYERELAAKDAECKKLQAKLANYTACESSSEDEVKP